MYLTGLSNKQAGVIYYHAKAGNIRLAKPAISYIYDDMVFSYTRWATMPMVMIMDQMKGAITKLFSKDYEGAEKDIKDALAAWIGDSDAKEAKAAKESLNA